MKAVFKADKAYTQVCKQEVMTMRDAYSDTMATHKGEEPKFIGKNFDVGVNDTILWSFSEGADHNQLTLTDPEEIERFREFVKDHPQFEEVEA